MATDAVVPVAVIGGGAAGFMAAIFAATHTRGVVLLERTRDGGRKILISGGGRCNVLPSQVDPAQYFTASSRNSLRRILSSWPLSEQREFFERTLGIELALEPESGKLFPVSNRARDVRDALASHARRLGADLRFESKITDISRADGSFDVQLESGVVLRARAVIVATGGLSVPATGSDGTGLRIVRRLGHTVHETYPALTPLTASPPVHEHLAGVSLDVTLRAPRARDSFETSGGFLFTHRGYSGPSVLNVSHTAVRARLSGEARQPILVQWSTRDASAWDELLRSESGRASVAVLLRRELPQRLADTLLAECGIAADQTLATLRREDRTRLIEALTRYELPWTSDEGYRKAEVTGGGVALAQVDPRTLESRVVPGLFLCGEILDAFGPIGGYNFLWAWATGRAAGIGAAESWQQEP